MCGRYSLSSPTSQIIEQFELSEIMESIVREFDARYNISPTQQIPVIRLNSGDSTRELVFMKWGETFSWSKRPLMNARKEKLEESSFWRDSYQEKRCIIPANSFYEWQNVGQKRKLPWSISLKNFEVFGFAGIWKKNQIKKTGQIIEWCSIITMPANELLMEIHNDGTNKHRQPAILDKKNHSSWLDTSQPISGDSDSILRQFKPEEFIAQKLKKVGDDKTHAPAQFLDN